jgi:hypothetical protein
MATRKTSVSLTQQAIEAADEAARRAGMSVSAWLSHAAVEHAWREQAVRAADEAYAAAVASRGPLNADQAHEVDAILAATVAPDRAPDRAAPAA